jgi:hypothetical protein
LAPSSLDEAMLYQLTDSDEQGEYRLAKRGGNGIEGLCVRIDKTKDGGVSILRIDPDGNRHPVPAEVLEGIKTGVLLEFWKQLLPHVVGLYRTRGDLSAIKIDDRDIIRKRLITDAITRLVRFLAPTIREIGARSPAPEELCLKIDHETGKREEIYIPKKQLTDRFAELPDSLRVLFAPLGIDQKTESAEDADFEGDMEGPPTEPNA